ncbi:MAG: alpha/beta hydrolase [Terricaulis sp.]
MGKYVIDGAHQRTLRSGALAFSAYEMGTGPLVLCLHGFPDTPRTYRLLLPALADAGFRAVAVTSRGYEASSRPKDDDYSLAALAGDVHDWMDALGADRAHLIGHDWGANLVYAAAASRPSRVDTLVTMAVPHPAAFAAALAGDFKQMRRSWYVYLFQLRGVAEAAVRQGNFAFLERLWREWSPDFDAAEDVSGVLALFAEPGVLEAVLQYYRTAFDAAHPRASESVALLTRPIEAPTLGLCGADDGCIAAEIFEMAMPNELFAGGVDVRRVANAGHFVHLERPQEVASLILSHLKGAGN